MHGVVYVSHAFMRVKIRVGPTYHLTYTFSIPKHSFQQNCETRIVTVLVDLYFTVLQVLSKRKMRKNLCYAIKN